MSKDSLLVRMDIKNSQNDLTKVLWFIAPDEASASAWLSEMEFEHIELANDAGGGAGRGGLRFSESRLTPLKDAGSLRVAEMGQMTLGDLFNLFNLMAQHASQMASGDEGEARGGEAVKAKPKASRGKSGAKGSKS